MATKGKAGPAMTGDDIQKLARAFKLSRVLLSGYELGVFAAVDKGATSAEVARRIKADDRATDRLLNALVVLGLLTKRAGVFRLTAASRKYLVPGGRDYLAGIAHTNHMWDRWGDLTAAVRRGRSPFAGIPRDDAGTAAFIVAMHYRATRIAPAIVRMLDLKGVTRVLDVGGGPGDYAIAFARASRRIHAAVFDLPTVVPLARRFIMAAGMAERVEAIAGDYEVGSLGRGYDLVFMSQILHSNSFAANVKLVKKGAAALSPGGRLVVQEFVVDEDRAGPPQAVLFALNMLAATDGGDTYTEKEIGEMMTRAGLRDLTRKDTPFDTTLIIGRKG